MSNPEAPENLTREDDEAVETNIKFPTEQPQKGEAPVVSEDKEENEKGRCNRFLTARGCSCIAHVSGKYPRTFSICTGIFIPLWFLVLVSLFFGHFLATVESQEEIDSNDAFMKQTVVIEQSRQYARDTLAMLPLICYQLFVNGITLDQVDEAFAQIHEAQSLVEYADKFDEFDEAKIVTWNSTDLREFMTYCGRVASDAFTSIEETSYQSLDVDTSVDGLSFNWIRCIDDSKVEGDSILFPSKARIEASRPEAQADFYLQTWRGRELKWREIYFEEFGGSSQSTFTTILQAFENALDDTTVGDKCGVNSMAGAWFWFTVMTTVGYGTQYPVTGGGRWLVFTFGFLSILAFGAILATAGSIVSVIFEDFLCRINLKLLTKKPVLCLIWGSSWYIWMLVVAQNSRAWTYRRLGEEMPFNDAYWFAYISTTTVGLGDFSPRPEVIFFFDLLIISFTFLMGFVLLSAFLGQFGGFIGEYFPNVGDKLTMKLKEKTDKRISSMRDVAALKS